MFKLEKIGLCVREQYIDFYGMEKDKVFITAKGVITLKHIGAFKNQLGDYRNVCTYEMLCQGYDSYQEYIDSEPVEKILKSMSVKNGFRANLIQYLQKQYGTSADCLLQEEKYFLGKSAYTDIMFSMIMDITRSKADHIITLFNENRTLEAMEKFDVLSDELDGEMAYRRLTDVLEEFMNDNLANENINCETWLCEKQDENTNGVLETKYDEFIDLLETEKQLSDIIENAGSHLTEIFEKKLREHSYENPLNW